MPLDCGLFIPPTIFDDVAPAMTVGQQEIVCFRFTSDAEALHLANDSDHGLAAGIWRRDINRIMYFSRRLASGQVYVNNRADPDMTVPCGGVKLSGKGRDKSLHELDECSQLKTVWMSLSR